MEIRFAYSATWSNSVVLADIRLLRLHDLPSSLAPCCRIHTGYQNFVVPSGVSILEGLFMACAQVVLCFNEMCLEFSPGIFCFRIDPTGVKVILEFSCIYDEAKLYVDELPLDDGLTRRGCVFIAMIYTCVEVLGWIFRVVGFPEAAIVGHKVCCRYPVLISVEVVNEDYG